jgi:hypothetical protein
MDNFALLFWIITAVVGLLLLYWVVYLFAGDFNFRRMRQALRVDWRTLRDPDFAARIEPLLTPSQATAGPAKPSGAPLRLLTLLQREGRLLDFLLEDIQSYSDDQVAAAVRDIHRQCQAALREHLDLQPVLPQEEGASIEVTSGFDPSAIRLTGNVTGLPPFRGALRHHGWRVRDIKLAPPPEGQDEFIVMPAEVELP